MALILKDLYEETKNTYQLKLICGRRGLLHIMNWVYISEDISTSVFLKGGELIISTGVSSNYDRWLFDFVQALIRQNTCGLIINTGQYLYEEDITEEVIRLCEENEFPLFTMPWHIHIFDITHNYYDRIFQDSQTENILNTTFLDIIYNRGSMEDHLAVLEGYGYPSDESYRICLLRFRFTAAENSGMQEKITLFVKHCLIHENMNAHACFLRRYILLILPLSQSPDITDSLEKLTLLLKQHFPDAGISAGLGSLAASLSALPSSFRHASAAASLAASRGDSFCCFDTLGFFKLLVSVQDPAVLESYINEQLGTVLQYDELHKTDYTETLYQYLLCNGSIQNIAAALFCHRNTVNYRIRFLKEELAIRLDDTTVRFELMAAFQAKKYLETIKYPAEIRY